MRTIADLREILFDTLRALHDKKDPMEVERANAVANVANAIVNSARTELHFLELLGGTGTGFVPEVDDQVPRSRIPEGVRLGKG